MVDCENRGKKVDERQLQLSPYLKNSTKTYFLLLKSPKKRCVIFCPPPFSGLFLRGEKWFSARCVVEKHMFKAEQERDCFIVYHKMSCRRFSGRETDLLDVTVVSLNSFGFFPCEQCHGGVLK
jgi:hypothetical protein